MNRDDIQAVVNDSPIKTCCGEMYNEDEGEGICPYCERR